MIYLLIFLLLIIAAVLFLYIKNFSSQDKIYSKLIVSICVVLLTLAIIIYPGESLNSALDGIRVWFNIIFPSLFPFLIGSELLVNLGVVNFLGMLLEPVMRPIFKVPGCGSFPFIMSITSGYPVGSKIVAELYNKKMCSRTEAQRLLSFCSTSGPLFMMGAVGIGMLNTKISGIIIALSHYLGALTVGFLFRFYKHKEEKKTITFDTDKKRAIKTLIESLGREKRPLGLLLSDCIRNSINTIFMIGGFIILFSVIIKLITLSGIIDILSRALLVALSPFNINNSLLKPIASGFMEITIGSKLIASSEALLQQKIIALCGIIAWGGFSIHAQVSGMISSTDLKVSTYILSKGMHSIFSCIYAYIFLSFINIPVFLSETEVFINKNVLGSSIDWFTRITLSTGKFFYVIAVTIIAALICRTILNMYHLMVKN